MLIREAFLRGISTRQVGGEVVSPQTVSKLTRDLYDAVKQFHQARLGDDWDCDLCNARMVPRTSTKRSDCTSSPTARQGLS
jgi:hypothetical protein